MQKMSLKEFQNEAKGNTVAWRIVHNAYSNTFFVYRLVEDPRPHGEKGGSWSEYLSHNGQIAHHALNGRFANMGEIALAFARFDGLSEENKYQSNYAAFLKKWKEGIPAMG